MKQDYAGLEEGVVKSWQDAKKEEGWSVRSRRPQKKCRFQKDSENRLLFFCLGSAISGNQTTIVS